MRADCHEGAEGTVTFTDLGDGRTQVDFHTAIRAIGALSDAAAGGPASAVDRLAEHLA